MQNNLCYIGLGSNIGDSVTIIKEALTLLNKITQTQLKAASPLYSSEPVSEIEQERYINAVACIQTALKPHELLLELQAIEEAYYRVRDPQQKWGPRTLDLDIILFGKQRIDDSHITIPHPEMQNRLFVLKPLYDIAGDLYFSGLGSLSYLIDNAPQYELHKLDD